jgi:hypothetical protein
VLLIEIQNNNEAADGWGLKSSKEWNCKGISSSQDARCGYLGFCGIVEASIKLSSIFEEVI